MFRSYLLSGVICLAFGSNAIAQDTKEISVLPGMSPRLLAAIQNNP